MCASALRQMGIKEVYVGCANDRFGGCGSVLNVNEYELVSALDTLLILKSMEHPAHPQFQALYGYKRDEAIIILRKFYITENKAGKS